MGFFRNFVDILLLYLAFLELFFAQNSFFCCIYFFLVFYLFSFAIKTTKTCIYFSQNNIDLLVIYYHCVHKENARLLQKMRVCNQTFSKKKSYIYTEKMMK